jgi:hypothetical protein
MGAGGAGGSDASDDMETGGEAGSGVEVMEPSDMDAGAGGGDMGGDVQTPTGGGGLEDNSEGCTVPEAPSFDQSVDSPYLPDPFKYIDGSRISSKAEWACLRANLNAIVQKCIYGPKMPPPDSLESTFSGGMLTINMTVGGQSGSFSVSISGGGSESDPAPCLISCGGSSLGQLQGVASITLPSNNIASEQNTSGLVHTLYGNAAQDSGACIGWAWGLSRIIDALEQHPEAGVDTTRIAVTGCSRNGKGALAMGAFDERVALTIPQEGGSGGPASWKVAAAEYAAGQNIQEAGEIIGEARWMAGEFAQYANPRSNNNRLPGDQHMVIALCAPRAVLVIDNDIDWLGPVACYAGGAAAKPVYEALGVPDRIGVTIAANHGHCMFPQSQRAYLDAFVNRFLKGGSDDTSGVDELNATNSTLGTFNWDDFVDWDTPTLSGDLAWDPFA